MYYNIIQSIRDDYALSYCRTGTPYTEQKSSGMTTKIKKKIQNYQQQMSNEGTHVVIQDKIN